MTPIQQRWMLRAGRLGGAALGFLVGDVIDANLLYYAVPHFRDDWWCAESVLIAYAMYFSIVGVCMFAGARWGRQTALRLLARRAQ